MVISEKILIVRQLLVVLIGLLMAHQLFLSHDSRDHERAEILAKMIERITLNQISVWHSSDSSAKGGLVPGNVWLDEIRSRLVNSKAVVALLTPTSIARPWLLFESGFGAAQVTCDVIPVCIGIDSLSDIPFPLAMYQTYQLSDYESIIQFAKKLTSKYEILFDEEMVKPVLMQAVTKLSQARSTLIEKGKAVSDPSNYEVIEKLKEHIDRRLLTIISTHIEDDQNEGGMYSVPITFSTQKNGETTQYVEISARGTVQHVLDNIYFMLMPEVVAFSYLEQWLLLDIDTSERLVIREIMDRVPANVIFKNGSRWRVVRLDEPYVATDSKVGNKDE